MTKFEDESKISVVNNRNQFLEWLLGLTGEPEEPEPEVEAVAPENCQPCGKLKKVH